MNSVHDSGSLVDEDISPFSITAMEAPIGHRGTCHEERFENGYRGAGSLEETEFGETSNRDVSAVMNGKEPHRIRELEESLISSRKLLKRVQRERDQLRLDHRRVEVERNRLLSMSNG
jgi:hypothetical protein